jgi:hypothetical protein
MQYLFILDHNDWALCMLHCSSFHQEIRNYALQTGVCRPTRTPYDYDEHDKSNLIVGLTTLEITSSTCMRITQNVHSSYSHMISYNQLCNLGLDYNAQIWSQPHVRCVYSAYKTTANLLMKPHCVCVCFNLVLLASGDNHCFLQLLPVPVLNPQTPRLSMWSFDHEVWITKSITSPTS